MVGRVAGKVAFITGAGRGQGRAHALRLAQEGADIIAVDICSPVGSVEYAMSTEADLTETARQVEALDRRVVTAVADVRNQVALDRAVESGTAELGGLDLVVANAGIASYAAGTDITEGAWQEMIDINLTGVWHTLKATVPALRARGGGSIVITNSGAGIIAPKNLSHYVTAKHGLNGLMKAFANELGAEGIRVNSVHPTQVETPMIMNDQIFRMFRPDLDAPTRDDIVDVSTAMNVLPVPWVQPEDIANAALFLLSDEARYVTGCMLTVDAGVTIKT